jgi:hypothetical protein
LPEYVNQKVFEWACNEVNKKKKLDTRKTKLIKIKEDLCVQCIHIGSYDEEAKTLKLIEEFIGKNSLINDINETRRHHEIYLSDTRKTEPEKLKTILRIPVKIK